MESLADPTRLRLLRLLERQELGVVELCDVLQAPQSTVSRHLKLLSDQGWISSRREGTASFYRMTLDELSPGARKLWLLAREQTGDWPTVEQDRLRLERVLEKRHKDSLEFFAGAASEWDSLRTSLYGQGFTQSAMLALLPPEWTVADLGCGTGAMTAELARHVKRVIGVDNSAAMLKAAKKRVGEAANVDLRRGALEALPIDDGACDAAILSLVLTYVPDPAAVLREAARILKPGGRLVVVDLLRHDREDFRRQMGQRFGGFELPEVESMLRNAGLEAKGVNPLPPEPSAKGPALMLATAIKFASNGNGHRADIRPSL
jgi:ArsR family transcriptional regulator